ncbi:protein phosphatase 2C domain-containing protein [Pendulispora brunnea]|uniref:Protein phosphatase 2C domain-containing protein n=1 Tax=Pendulispora brunnea TaxID=2905690 RepID=A0ABZ2KFQ6_9BACT
MTIPAIEFAERTHPGRDPSKQVNEDSCGHRETALGHLAVVCDGMGGHEGGREASQLALNTIFEVFERAGGGEPREGATLIGPGGATAFGSNGVHANLGREPARVLREAIEEANRRVHAMASSDAARPGATVVAILHHHGGTEVAHAGDSRCYLIHAGNIVQLTKDHSMVQQMVDAQLLTPEQAAVHPDANRISRALGMKPEIDVELRPQPVQHVVGDVFVLCSDGLSDMVEPSDILRLGAQPAAQAAGQLVDLANARGGHDNISVQVLRARESALAQPQFLAPTVVDTKPPPPVGPSGTVVIPAAPAAPSVARPILPTKTDEDEHHAEAHPTRRSPIVIVGVLLGLAGVGIIIAIYVLLGLGGGARKRHPVVEDDAAAAAPPPPPAMERQAAPAPTPTGDAEAAPLPSLIHPTTHPRLKRDR